jgi:hypothetical protein
VDGSPPAERALVAAESTTFMETNLSFDSTYSYAVQAVTHTGESALSPADTLIPGPVNFWIADFNGSRVWRISYDGSHVLGYEYFSSPEALATQPPAGSVWIADYYEKAVYCITVQFEVVHRMVLSGQPIDIALDPSTGTLYILQRLPDMVLLISSDGNHQDSLEVPDNIGVNGALALDTGTGRLWLSDPNRSGIGGQIYHRNAPYDGNRWRLAADVAYPNDITVNSATGDCWAATDSGLVRFSPDTDTTLFLPNLRTEDLSLNLVNGDCYFVGFNQVTRIWQVGRISGSLNSEVDLILNHSSYLADIQVLQGEISAGFLVSQISTGSILRMTPEGRLLGRLDGFYRILEFALE